jgi:hypothetical protein
MELNIRNAAKIFFPNPFFEMVYIEAVNNSVDANATNIDIKISLKSFSDPKSLKIEIIDNGDGFTDIRFEKFKKLLEVEEEDHKGLGRLVYMRYFNHVGISSIYKEGKNTKKRKFIFSDEFNGEYTSESVSSVDLQTVLTFSDFRLLKIYSYDNVKAQSIKEELLLHFYPLFYRLKVEGKKLQIKISVSTEVPNTEHDFKSDIQQIDVSQLPDLHEELLPNNIDLLSELKLHYSIKPLSSTLLKSSVITAICVDDRTVKVDILSRSGIPPGYEIIFILYSNLFTGKVDTSRQVLAIDDVTLKIVKKLFGDKVAEILNKEIPKIQTINKETIQILEETYPHLHGLFDENPVGLIDRNESLNIAQSKFFKEQKEVLNAESLTDEQYQKTLDISARILTEYILYRNVIVNKLKAIKPENKEKEIHNIIAPMGRTYKKGQFHQDIYTNNAWLLDDKYMSYTTILSDREMDELVKTISFDKEAEKDAKKPDIAIVFSSDPEKEQKVDVVIVELKRLGLDLADKETVVSQLKQRARKLLQHYPDKIQRIWFYGVVDFDDEFKKSLLEDKYAEIFSTGTVFYKEQPIILDLETKKEIPVGLFLLDFNALINDAATRNQTFLNIVKESFKKIN